MDDFRRHYDRADGRYQVVLRFGTEWIDLEVELPSAEEVPCRYYYTSQLLQSCLTEREENFITPIGIMVDRIHETLSPEVIDVAQRTISEFLCLHGASQPGVNQEPAD